MKEDRVSVIIVNWNGLKWLQNCLKSLQVQTYPNYEIIFVDNLSSDNSVTYVSNNFPDVQIVQTGSNLGFAGGNNAGLRVATGELILLLNNDTLVPSTFISDFVAEFKNYPNAASAQSKILLMSDHTTLDVCGSFWTSTTFLYHFGAEKKDSPEYNTNAKFFSNKGASMLIRKAVIDDIGLFDEDFWCYYEETDFCNRAWLSGYECVYLPKATAYHANGGSSLLFANDFIQFHNFKNKIMSMVKNFEISTLILRLPQHIFIIISISIYWLITGKVRHFTAIHKALLWNMINIKSTLKKRRVVQKFRTVSDTFIFSKVQRNPKFSYYTALLRNELKKYSDTEF